MDGAQRPAFSLAPADGRPMALPLSTWLLSAAGLAMVVAAVMWAAPLHTGRCAELSPPCDDGAGAALGPAGLSFLVAAVAFLSLPAAGPGRATRGASGLAALGGGLVLLGALLAWFDGAAARWALVPVGLAAPAAMLGATSPAAPLGPPSWRSPERWLRVGAVVALAAAAGLGAAWGVATGTSGASGVTGAAALGAQRATLLLGAVLVAGGGFLGLRTARPEGPPARKAPRRLGLTTMLSYDLLAEVGLIVAGSACASAFLLPGRTLEDVARALPALGGGLLGGGLLYAVSAPSLERLVGRGLLLSSTYTAAAACPLLVAFAQGAWAVPALLAAGALAGFTVASAPQRFALALDLCPSRTRLRSSLDFHAVRLASGSAGVLLIAADQALLGGLGLVMASALGAIGIATFVPTLGSLGRRSH